jgi:dihydroorotase
MMRKVLQRKGLQKRQVLLCLGLLAAGSVTAVNVDTKGTSGAGPFPARTGWGVAQASADYDFLIKGGHVIDPKSRTSAVRDVAVKDGRVAAIASNIAASRALKTVDASGLYVTPGLVDIHVHVYPGERQ